MQFHRNWILSAIWICGGLLLVLLAWATEPGRSAAPLLPSSPVLDGHRDAEYRALAVDPAGDLGSPPGGGDAAWSDAITLSVASDTTYLYVYIDLPAYAQSTAGGEIGLALDTIPGAGGASDPWNNAMTFAYTSTHNNLDETPIFVTLPILPDVVIRGNIPGTPGNTYNSWTELRTWTGSGWSAGGTNWGGIGSGSQVGSRVAYANGEGVEFKIAYSELGTSGGGLVNLQLFTTQKGGTKGAYDTTPSDDQSQGWDDATVQRKLASYTLEGGGATPTPGPSPTPTATVECTGAALGDGAIQTSVIYHNSEDPNYRTPTGALPMTGTATLRLRTCHSDVQQVAVWVWKTGAGTPPSYIYTASVTGTLPGGYDLWTVQVPGPDVVTDQWYQFRITDATRSGYYHVAGTNNAGPGAWSDSFVNRSWKLETLPVPPADYAVPDWMQDAVIYQIFPDRFRNGNTANDPPPYTAGVRIYGPNTCNGYPHGRGSGPQCVVDGRSWNDSLLIPSYGIDFYGGDLEGVTQKINDGYFDRLGVNVIYLNPIFEASSNHGYDTNDYYNVRGYFGGNAAFDTLLATADAHGIRIILDGVFNHAGSDSKYVDGYGLNRWPADTGACEGVTPYRSWFTAGSSGQGTCADGWGWKGWAGYETIPEFVDDDAEVRKFFFRGGSAQSPNGIPVARYWLDKGVAGWRFDVAQDITHAWWQEMRPYLKSTYGTTGTLMLGEVTGGCDWGLYQSYVNQNELDSAMNYCFRDWAIGFANGGNPGSFDSALQGFRNRFARSAFYAMMNLLGSHDSTRALRLLNDDPARLKLAVLLQMTLPGAPSVYYGDEVGVTGGGDPDNRRTYPWGNEDLSILNHYQKVIGLRRAHSALRRGELATLLIDDGNHLYGYIRWDDRETVVVVLNNQAGARTASLGVGSYLSNGTVLTDTLNGGTAYTVTNGTLAVPVDGQWGVILAAAESEAPQPNFSSSTKSASPIAAIGDRIDYTITVRNTGAGTATAYITDTLPLSTTAVLTSLPAGMTATAGRLIWQGPVTAGQELPLRFQVRVAGEVPSGTLMINQVQVAPPDGSAITRSATTTIYDPNYQEFGYRIYLPVVLRQNF